jgi:hypothetical protein
MSGASNTSSQKRSPPETQFRLPAKKVRRAILPPSQDSQDSEQEEGQEEEEGIIPELLHARPLMSHNMDIRPQQKDWTVVNPPQPGVWTEEQVHEQNMAYAKLDWLMGKYSTMSPCEHTCDHITVHYNAIN